MKRRVEFYVRQPFCLSLLSCFVQVFGVPHPYCLRPLNKADCQGKPTPVFSYYKPGSRCEIGIWKGCPTTNMFDNQYECNNLCIGRITEEFSPKKDDVANEDPCLVPIDTKDCNKLPEQVYTYDQAQKQCVLTIWKGCPSRNKFDSEAVCKNTCVLEENTAPKDFNLKLAALDEEQLTGMNAMMKAYMEHAVLRTDPNVRPRDHKDEKDTDPDHEHKKVADINDNRIDSDAVGSVPAARAGDYYYIYE